MKDNTELSREELIQIGKEQKKEYNRRWRKENIEKMRGYQRRWRRENPEKIKQYQENHYISLAKKHLEEKGQ